MKRVACLILVAATALVACKKSNKDRGCISTYSETFNIPAADLQAAFTLLQNNNISSQNIKITSVYLNDTVIANGQKDRYDYIYMRYYSSGLPVFYSDGVFSFKNGVYLTHAGPNIVNFSLGTTPQLKLNDVRGLFVNAYNQQFNSTNVRVADSCLRAEFGYYSFVATVNGAAVNATPVQNVVKAWKVQFQNTTYPIAYFRDDDSALIGFDGGIVPFASANRSPR